MAAVVWAVVGFSIFLGRCSGSMGGGGGGGWNGWPHQSCPFAIAGSNLCSKEKGEMTIDLSSTDHGFSKCKSEAFTKDSDFRDISSQVSKTNLR